MSFKGAKVVRLIPDSPGRGGTKTALSTHSKVLDTYLTYNCTVFLGRWSTATQPVQTGLYAAPITMGYAATGLAVSQAIYNFAAIDTTNANLVPNNHLMEHLYDTGVAALENMLFDHSISSPDARIAYSGLSGGVNFCVPATMISIRNRCFICWGGKDTTVGIPNFGGGHPTMVIDNIIYDPTNTNQKQYDIGVKQPQTASTYVFDPSSTSSGTTSVTSGSNKVNNATVSGNWSASTAGISIGGVPYVVQSPSGYTTTFATGGTMQAITSGTSTCTINGFLFPVNGDWNGLTINIAAPNAESKVISSYVLGGGNTTVTIVGTWANNHALSVGYTVTGEELALTTSYQGATTLSESYVAGSGALSWTGIGPQYAYAYYDTITGHISNVSPIMQVMEQNQIGINVKLSNIAYSQDHDSNRFKKIIIFRTLASQGGISGGVLYPIGDGSGNFDFVTNALNSFGGTTTYVDNKPDTSLLQNAGLQAPLTTNRTPIGSFAHMMYWDGRVWGNPVSDPTALTFSCDTVQCPFGVPEESFPSQNLLRIPAEDGRITGMKLVGSYGIITTNRYSYYISGNNELNYRIQRFASTTFGVSDYQMAEFAGDTTDNSAALVYLGGDSKIYMLSPSYGNVSMSEPIQDLLFDLLSDNQVNFSSTKVAPISVGAQKFLLVSVPVAGSQRSIFLYDFDRKIWTFHNPGSAATGGTFGYAFASFTTVYQTLSSQGSSVVIPADFVMSWQGNIFSWMRPASQAIGVDPAFIQTFPFDFGRKSKKQINEIRLYCNAALTPGWTVQVIADEHTLPRYGPVYTPTLNEDPQYQMQGGATQASSVSGSPFPLDSVDARELVVPLPQDGENALIANRFEFQINFPTANVSSNLSGINPYELYAVDIVYTDMADADDESV